MSLLVYRPASLRWAIDWGDSLFQYDFVFLGAKHVFGSEGYLPPVGIPPAGAII